MAISTVGKHRIGWTLVLFAEVALHDVLSRRRRRHPSLGLRGLVAQRCLRGFITVSRVPFFFGWPGLRMDRPNGDFTTMEGHAILDRIATIKIDLRKSVCGVVGPMVCHLDGVRLGWPPRNRVSAAPGHASAAVDATPPRPIAIGSTRNKHPFDGIVLPGTGTKCEAGLHQFKRGSEPNAGIAPEKETAKERLLSQI